MKKNNSEVSKVDELRSQQLYDDFCEFVNEFKGESDRAAVILGTSKLDQLLAMILEKFLLPSTTSTDQLFDNNGPLGTFSSKIDLCFRLGLIDAEFCRAIHLVRKIRNSFAHEVYGASLENGSHKDRVKVLISGIRDEPYFQKLKEIFFDKSESSRNNFSATLGLMVARLDGLYNNIKTISGHTPKTLCPVLDAVSGS